MKKALIIIPNLLIMGFILFFILRYAQTRTEESDRTSVEAISYIRKAKISPEISGHLIFPDDSRLSGISTAAAVADAYDAMTSHRSYRDIIPQDYVKSEIEKGMGSQFDERFAKIMLAMIEEDKEYIMHEN